MNNKHVFGTREHNTYSQIPRSTLKKSSGSGLADEEYDSLQLEDM